MGGNALRDKQREEGGGGSQRCAEAEEQAPERESRSQEHKLR